MARRFNDVLHPTALALQMYNLTVALQVTGEGERLRNTRRIKGMVRLSLTCSLPVPIGVTCSELTLTCGTIVCVYDIGEIVTESGVCPRDARRTC